MEAREEGGGRGGLMSETVLEETPCKEYMFTHDVHEGQRGRFM